MRTSVRFLAGALAALAATLVAAQTAHNGVDPRHHGWTQYPIEVLSSRPDAMPKLEATIEAVVDKVRSELSPKTLLIGGRSMGGRAASMMTAKQFNCDGLMLYAYPLHPAGHPEKLRDAHLPSIEVPVLCINGTRDPLCTPELMEAALKTVKTDWTMHWIDGADHSFHVPKSSGRTDAQVLDEVANSTERWIEGLGKSK